MRIRNKGYYRVLHWPIWIWVFFLAPGPLRLSASSPRIQRCQRSLARSGAARNRHCCSHGQLPGVEAAPYILRFDEDPPQPSLSQSLLHLRMECGHQLRAAEPHRPGHRRNHRRVDHEAALPVRLLSSRYFDPAAGRAGKLPRVGKSTKNGVSERRYFYGTVWAVTISQTVLLVLWKTLPLTRTGSFVKLLIYTGMLFAMGAAAYNGALPRTRPILPGELMVD